VITMEEMAKGHTLAEAMGMTAELGCAVARLAGAELEAGRLDTAEAILEGLAIANPRDPMPWAMLAQVARRQGKVWAAYLCAEAAARLAPEDLQIKLVHAEALLGIPEEAARGREELGALAGAGGAAGERARALLQALGP
jgi:predicted Zn-dependent protease